MSLTLVQWFYFLKKNFNCSFNLSQDQQIDPGRCGDQQSKGQHGKALEIHRAGLGGLKKNGHGVNDRLGHDGYRKPPPLTRRAPAARRREGFAHRPPVGIRARDLPYLP